MMEDATKQIKKQSRRDRVTLDPVAVSRLNAWITQIQLQLKGVQISRSDLVNFLIFQRGETLNPSEIQLLRKSHFDEAQFAEWALKEFKKAKDRGENPSLAEILKPVFPANTRPCKSRKSSKNPQTAGPEGAIHSSVQT
jgi:hypothetical protein